VHVCVTSKHRHTSFFFFFFEGEDYGSYEARDLFLLDYEYQHNYNARQQQPANNCEETSECSRNRQ
jgi:hypothetical protein